MEHRFRFTGCYLSLFSAMLSCFVCVCAARGKEGLVQPVHPGDPALVLPYGAGGSGLAEEPRLPRGRLERRLLAAAGRTHPRHAHISSLCQVCVFSVQKTSVIITSVRAHVTFMCVLCLSGSSPSMFLWRPRLWWLSSTSRLLGSRFPWS